MSALKSVASTVTALAMAMSIGAGTLALADTPRPIHPKTTINPQPLPPVAPGQPRRLQRTLRPGAVGSINPQPLPPLPPPAKRGPSR